jgi:geranylgeranyl pyrophosphate synthase
MTHAALLEPKSPLLELLDEQFSARLPDLVGSEAARVRWRLWHDSLYGPLADFLGRPGKEFRARLVHVSWQLGGQKAAPPAELPAIVEALHAGSLIVDDIEDGSNYRRGQPALHCTHGLPRALNAGNWLYFWPALLLERLALSPEIELALHRSITHTLLRCHHGQALDLSVRVDDLKQQEVREVVLALTRLKSGSLMELAAEVGARAAGASDKSRESIATFGLRLGLGLQMLDDYSGIVSEKRCHKGHEDLLLGRATWAWAWAAELADGPGYGRLVALSKQVQARDLHPEHLAAPLRDLIEERGRHAIHAHLTRALMEVEATCPEPSLLAALRSELELLEKSYG